MSPRSITTVAAAPHLGGVPLQASSRTAVTSVIVGMFPPNAAAGPRP